MKRQFKNIGIMKQLGIAAVFIGLLSAAVPESASALQNRTDQNIKPGELSLHQIRIENPVRHNLVAERVDENQAMFTFVTSVSDLDHANADSLADWINNGKISIKGLQIKTESVEIIHSGEIRFVADLTESFTGYYLDSPVQISGLEGFKDQSSYISIYPGKNHVVSISFNTRTEGKNLISKNQIYPELNRSYSSVNTRKAGPVVYHFAKNDESARGTFFHRNRFWLAGTAAVVAGSAAAAFIGSGSSPVYLPEPPGRPAFNR